ncbi:MAG: lipoyl(octanoyl) transferase LipB [Eubacteriales bacterium]
MKITICNIGRMPYDKALELQYDLVLARQENRIGNTLLLLEHPPVLTLGTRADPANIYLSREQLEARGVTIHEVNRGGDVTYHGPGQVIGYPIIQLHDYEQGIRGFINTMQASLIDLLVRHYGIEAHPRKDKYTGVWVGDKKIVAFGLAVQHGVTMHGFAFNVNTDLRHFDWINPCGLSLGVTSVAEESGHTVDMDQAFDLVAHSFADHFEWEIEWIDQDDLRKRSTVKDG